MDAIVVGIGTVLHDDPMLTARVETNGKQKDRTRVLNRVVLDRNLRMPENSQLVRTARKFPVLIACGKNIDIAKRNRLENFGCELFVFDAENDKDQLIELLQYLHHNSLQNVLIEGGASLMGAFHDADLIDELHVYTCPKTVGGVSSPSPLAGIGVGTMNEACRWQPIESKMLGGDFFMSLRKSIAKTFPSQNHRF